MKANDGSLLPLRRRSSPGRRGLAAERSRRGEGDRDVLDAVDEVGAEPLDLAVESDVGEPLEESVIHDADLHAGQVGTQAEVGSAAAEGHVVVGTAGDIEGVGVFED